MKRYGPGLLALVFVLGVVSLPAGAVEEIVIPIDTVIRAAEGELVLLASVDVEPELVGATCTVTAGADNNESVHPGNNIIVASGSDSTVLLDVEGVGGGVTIAESLLTLGETLTLTLEMGPDRVFSGGMTVTVTCDETEPTTTTTVPEPTTTTTVPEPTTTTTVPEPTTTTTVPEPTTTSTTAPPAATSTSTTIGPTTTTAADTTTTTSATEVLGAQIERSDELPATGVGAEILVAIGVALLATGLLLRRLVTER